MAPWFEDVWIVASAEFSDLANAKDFTRAAIRMLVAAALGAVLGYERERKGKPAGLRTHMLVALGSALFVIVPSQSGMDASDLSRVLQGLISGIGFLGAGAIIKLAQDREIHGLTTAASIWITASIGIAAGMGREMTALLGTVVALFVLTVLQKLERGSD
jgi:putative Mg2+ transporter-C (MgtC) family protein